jgi:hypothetical protein
VFAVYADAIVSPLKMGEPPGRRLVSGASPR